MSSTDVTKVLVAVAATLISALLLRPLQRDGIRKRIRQELHEELELIALLQESADSKAHTAQIRRIQHHVDFLVRRYSPDPELEKSMWPGITVGGVLVVGIFVKSLLLPQPGEATYWGVGVLIAVIGLVCGESVRRWQEINAANASRRRRRQAREPHL